MSTLKGGPELKARLRAVKASPRPIVNALAEDARDVAKSNIRVRTGRGRASIKVSGVSDTGASLTALYYVHILDTGAKAHEITPNRRQALRFQVQGKTVFSRRAMKPEQRGNGFVTKALAEAARRGAMADELIRQWNGAA